MHSSMEQGRASGILGEEGLKNCLRRDTAAYLVFVDALGVVKSVIGVVGVEQW